MKDGIQNYAVAKNERDVSNTVLTLRLNEAEAMRFWRIMDAAKERNPYVGKSDIIRELLGINSLKALTPDELIFFRTGEKQAAKQIETVRDLDNDVAFSRPEDFDLSDVTDYQMKGEKKIRNKKIEDAMKKAWDSKE